MLNSFTCFLRFKLWPKNTWTRPVVCKTWFYLFTLILDFTKKPIELSSEETWLTSTGFPWERAPVTPGTAGLLRAVQQRRGLQKVSKGGRSQLRRKGAVLSDWTALYQRHCGYCRRGSSHRGFPYHSHGRASGWRTPSAPRNGVQQKRGNQHF